MTGRSLAVPGVRAGRTPAIIAALAPTVALGSALVAAVAVRWLLAARAPGEGLAVGLVFGASLLAIGVAGGTRALPTIRLSHLTLGLGAGVVLVGLTVLVGRGDLPSLRPAVALLPWVAVTALVATAEEIALRGALFSALDRAGGPVVAVLVTSAAFALMHMPFYGWSAVPLDLGVGLIFGGLRLWTGGVAAPATAHVIADLATWWL